MLETYILKIDKDLSMDDFKKLLGFVSEEKKERILRFHRFEDAQRTLLGDAMARYAICKRFAINNKDLVFGSNDFGKPVLLSPSGIHFNISHSGNWIVCAIDTSPVGIDVETIKAIDLRIAERFFQKSEYSILINQPKEIIQSYFYKIWTLKESYIKFIGKGLFIALDSFSIEIEDNNIKAKNGNKYCNCFFSQIWSDKDTIISTCSSRQETPRVFLFSPQSFLT